MQQWLAFPWVRYVLWLLCGLLLAMAVPGWETAFLGLGVASAALYGSVLFLLKRNTAAAQLLWGMLAFFFLLGFGYWRMAQFQQTRATAEVAAGQWWVQVMEAPTKTAKSYRFRGVVSSVDNQKAEAGKRAAVQLAVVVYVPAAQEPPVAGQELFVQGRLQPVPAPLNPHEFDNRAYLASQQIYHQLFVSHHVVARPKGEAISFWQRVALNSRAQLLGIVSRLLPDPQAAAVVKAMVLGERSELDLSLRQAYANAGVMHVLAVSGLHVGMVFGLVYLLFQGLRRQWWQRLLWLLLVLLVLWGYAWLTGLAPSAQRAAAMFSIIAIGKTIKRRGNIYNSIALSAFVLLCWNPLLLQQVGFQLSYLAVLGIVYLQPRIKSWLTPKQPWVKKLWELMSVTLAAQLTTFPLGLYYFHQFPTYFFVGNLLAVPLAFLILYSTLLMLVFYWVPLLGPALGWLVNGLASGLNAWVQLTQQLPFSKLVATISSPQLLLLYGSLIAILLLIRQRSFGWGLTVFLLLLVFACSGLLRTHSLRNQQTLTIYQIPGHSLLHIVEGQQEVLLPIGTPPDERRLGYHVMPARLQAGFAPLGPGEPLPQAFALPKYESGATTFIRWREFSLVVIDGKKGPVSLPSGPLRADVLLLCNSPRISLEKLVAAFRIKQLVLDASNSLWYRQRVESEANLLHLPVHVTSEQGAYQINYE